MASNVLSTLQHVTNIKLGKVAHRQQSFEDKKTKLLAKALEQSTPAARTMVLAEDAINRDTPEAALGIPPNMLKHFLQQAALDPSVSEAQINAWDLRLKHALDCQSHRHQLTSLFGELVTEYLKHPNVASGANKEGSEDGFEQIGREEMHQQRRQWEEYAFTSHTTDEGAIHAHLEELFDAQNTKKKPGKTPLEKLRISMEDFVIPRMDGKDVKTSIQALLNADLFDGDKRKALVSMQPLSSLCSEVSDCLNSDLDFIGDWKWDNTPILLHQRRQLNGKYRVYMDEEIYQAILIQYIGLHWASHFKAAFKAFEQSDAWAEDPASQMNKQDRERRDWFLKENLEPVVSLSARKKMLFSKTYFCTQLPDGVQDSRASDYNNEGESNNRNRKSFANVKQTILRQVATLSAINTRLYGDFTVLQSDFKWFGPSLPHTTINAVLRFMHVPEKWLYFFNKFLKAPLAFVQDGKQRETRERQSGIPMSHTISDAMGEAVLFTLDYCVNQRTGGTDLIRFHDDLWVWGSTEQCEKGWAALNDFTKVMGLALNLDKTGTVAVHGESRLQSTTPASTSLPKGKVTWGFLRLAESGKWEIDQAEVDKHIQEIQRQLAACRSIMAFISAYNAYVARFLINNFGKPAECLGRPHIEDAMRTISRVNRAIFKDTHGDAAEHLRQVISTRFGIKDRLPDGFFYFPQAIGGLGLQNPLLALQLQWSKAKEEQPGTLVDKALDEEAVRWAEKKQQHALQSSRRDPRGRPASVGEHEDFVDLDEYMRYPELRCVRLAVAFEGLMKELDLAKPEVSTELGQLASGVPALKGSAMRAALQLYGHGVLEYCGNVRLGEEEMLPAGLLEMLQSEKFRWQG